MISKIKTYINNSLKDPNYIPDYVLDASNIVRINKEIKMGIDFASTIYINNCNKYNSPITRKLFEDVYPLKIPYHRFLYEYLIRRCAIIHTCSTIDEEDIKDLKKYIAIFKDYNIGRFDSDAFTSFENPDTTEFYYNNVKTNISYLSIIYDNELASEIELEYISFNYPEINYKLYNIDYSCSFYDKDYNYFYELMMEYLKNRNSNYKLKLVLNYLNMIDNNKQGGSAIKESINMYNHMSSGSSIKESYWYQY